MKSFHASFLFVLLVFSFLGCRGSQGSEEVQDTQSATQPSATKVSTRYKPSKAEIDFRDSVLRDRTRTFIVRGGTINLDGRGSIVSAKHPNGIEYHGRFNYFLEDSPVTVTCDGELRVIGDQFKVEVGEAVVTGSGSDAYVSFDVQGQVLVTGHQNYTLIGFPEVRAGSGSRVHFADCGVVEVGQNTVVTAVNCATVDLGYSSANVRAQNCEKIVVKGSKSTVLVVGTGEVEASDEALKNVTRE